MLKNPEGGYLVCYQYMENDNVIQSCRPFQEWSAHKKYEEMKNGSAVVKKVAHSFSRAQLVSLD